MNNFNNLLTEIRKMQVPIITVTNISNGDYDRAYIITADGKNKIITHLFDDDCLCKVSSIDMSFHEAIINYSQVVLNNPGSTFKLISM